jgi:hypothetical protein
MESIPVAQLVSPVIREVHYSVHKLLTLSHASLIQSTPR